MDSAKNMNAIFSIITAEPINLDELCNLSECSRHTIVKSVSKLISNGYVERLENGVYRLSNGGKSLKTSGDLIRFRSGPSGQYNRNRHSQDTLRSRIWRLILLNRKVTISEMVGLTINGNEKNPVNNIQQYVRALVKGGYLREMPRRLKGLSETSNGFKQFMLIKNNGRLAPVLRNNKKELYDPNTGDSVIW